MFCLDSSSSASPSETHPVDFISQNLNPRPQSTRMVTVWWCHNDRFKKTASWKGKGDSVGKNTTVSVEFLLSFFPHHRIIECCFGLFKEDQRAPPNRRARSQLSHCTSQSLLHGQPESKKQQTRSERWDGATLGKWLGLLGLWW